MVVLAPILIAIFAGLIILQIFLSKKESKWPGLILPILSLCLSIIAVLGMAVPGHEISTADENGIIIEDVSVKETLNVPPQLLAQAGSAFLTCNIPTIIFVVIYLGFRKKWRQRKALEKMQAQDLG